MWKSVLVLLLVLCGCSNSEKLKAEFQTETKDISVLLKNLHKSLSVGVSKDALDLSTREFKYLNEQLQSNKKMAERYPELMDKLKHLSYDLTFVYYAWTNMDFGDNELDIDDSSLGEIWETHPELKKETSEGGLLLNGKVSIRLAMPIILSMLSDSVGGVLDELKNPTMKK
jgi:hypothetical protein